MIEQREVVIKQGPGTREFLVILPHKHDVEPEQSGGKEPGTETEGREAEFTIRRLPAPENIERAHQHADAKIFEKLAMQARAGYTIKEEEEDVDDDARQVKGLR